MQFGSDNQTGASAQILDIIVTANSGYAHGYGDDAWTSRAVDALREVFEFDLDAFFVATGTAANSLALSCLVHPWEMVLCHGRSHIITDESTAPELFTGGARLVGLAHGEGKLSDRHLVDYFQNSSVEVPHNPRPAALSLTQVTESGLVYTPDEVASLTSTARSHQLAVHMDGARFANAIAALGCTPAEITWKAGIDILCLGATKNGCLAAEAVIFFKPGLSEHFIHRRKRAGHLLSKGRFLSAQIVGWLQDGHWLKLACHANQQAAHLAKRLASIPGVRVVWPTEANEVFVIMPKPMAHHLQALGAEFYEWYRESLPKDVSLNEDELFVRLVASFATEDQDVQEFCDAAQEVSSTA
jgi:threonine aldolase